MARDRRRAGRRPRHPRRRTPSCGRPRAAGGLGRTQVPDIHTCLEDAGRRRSCADADLRGEMADHLRLKRMAGATVTTRNWSMHRRVGAPTKSFSAPRRDPARSSSRSPLAGAGRAAPAATAHLSAARRREPGADRHLAVDAAGPRRRPVPARGAQTTPARRNPPQPPGRGASSPRRCSSMSPAPVHWTRSASAAVAAPRDRTPGAVDRDRQHEAVVVVGVLADQVHPARRTVDARLTTVAPHEALAERR